MTAGERWATEALEALRAGRFGPQAWAHFLAESFRRAAEARRQRPRLARQARAWSLVGFCAGLGVCAWMPRARLPAPDPWRFAAWWLAVSAMLDWHLGMVEGPQGEDRERLTAADAVTLTRLWSAPILAAQDQPTRDSRRVFIALIATAAASDAFDGPLARRAGITRLGGDLDTIADAVTLASAARAARRAGWLPTGAARLVAMRSSLPVAVVAATYFRTGQRPASDCFGATRRLAPVLLGGLGAAPFSPRAGATLTSAASLASLALYKKRATPASS